jgi:serine/threonine protein kinase
MVIKDIIRNIDNGGFGNVDEVLCDDGKHYARKTFSMNIPHNESLKKNALMRFKREAIYQETLKHPNIVPILFKDLSGDSPYYIMPLAENTLKNIDLKERNDITKMLFDVMAGVESMHDSSVYHRDLKPGNILRFIDSEGKFYYAIADFGLLSIDQTNITDLTPISMTKGTDYYTAPEIVASMARASIQSDIFSLGCLMHDYFGSGSRVPCQPITEDGLIGQVMANCTHKKPPRRFKSVSSLREAMIALDDIELDIKSEEGQRLVKLFEKSDEVELDYETWESILSFLENDKNESEDITALFKLVSLSDIKQLVEIDAGLANAYAILFAEWVRETSFLFNFCDLLGGRLNFLIENCSLQAQVKCIIALLIMGTRHNRFYVEQICYKWLQINNDELGRMLSIEILTEGKLLCYNFNHLERSISARRGNYNDIIQGVLGKICI